MPKRAPVILPCSFLMVVLALLLAATNAPAQQSPPVTSSSDSAGSQQSGSPANPQRPAGQVEQPPIVSTTRLVHLVVTVMDHHHDFVTDLDKTDFKVLENGKPQTIGFFG